MKTWKCPHCGKGFKDANQGTTSAADTVAGIFALTKNLVRSGGMNLLKTAATPLICPHCRGIGNVCPNATCGTIIGVHLGDVGSEISCHKCKLRFIANGN